MKLSFRPPLLILVVVVNRQLAAPAKGPVVVDVSRLACPPRVGPEAGVPPRTGVHRRTTPAPKTPARHVASPDTSKEVVGAPVGLADVGDTVVPVVAGPNVALRLTAVTPAVALIRTAAVRGGPYVLQAHAKEVATIRTRRAARRVGPSLSQAGDTSPFPPSDHVGVVPVPVGLP